MNSQLQMMLSGQVLLLFSGTSFFIVGLASLAVAAIRKNSGGGVRAVVFLGIWSTMYGAQRLTACSTLVTILPGWLQSCVPYVETSITYLLIVAAALSFRELVVGKLRRFVTALALSGLLIALLAVGWFVVTGEKYTLIRYNNLITAGVLIVLLIFLSVPALNRKYGVLQYRGVLLIGCSIFCVEALYVSLQSLGMDHDIGSGWDDLGFAALLSALAYVDLQRVYANERRLSTIENDLAIARQVQFSILPTTTPRLSRLRIAAAYEPMTAVAGDFYEFLPVDEHRIGFLITDVSGHGVPAALIASMIKVAVQSVAAHAADPAELLRHLRDILSADLRGQFVSAAYLWIDTEAGNALYSAAGHPPLLHWRAANSSLECITSNGALFGVPFETEYPVRELPCSPGDRFLLYTDGISEPENEVGEAFGE
ncbi:MAG TPA: SpoIIE family protein phosphatase, partial [Candidatus Methylomirabilis sp.]|nr:SpoIIE family protein phosphatase [Candidatus Methylomirabilis sp.]